VQPLEALKNPIAPTPGNPVEFSSKLLPIVAFEIALVPPAIPVQKVQAGNQIKELR
jgi:hypothetical protein